MFVFCDVFWMLYALCIWFIGSISGSYVGIKEKVDTTSSGSGFRV